MSSGQVVLMLTLSKARGKASSEKLEVKQYGHCRLVKQVCKVSAFVIELEICISNK